MVNQNNNNNADLHVAMFPFFAFGHVSPFVQLSNKLAAHGGVKISFLSAAANVHRTKSMLNQTSATQIIPLTLPAVDGLPPGVESTADTTPENTEFLKVALDLMQPQIKTLLNDLKPDFVVFDFAQEWLPELAQQLGIKSIYFSVFAAISTAFATVPARLEGSNPPTVEQAKFPPPGFPKTSITSIRTFEAADLLYIFMSFNGIPSVYNKVLAGLKNCTSILIKSCNELEKPYIDYVRSQFNNKPILLAGPVVPEPKSGTLDPKWSDWLNQFESKSVIYCSFGSETYLNHEQIRELALGLELTGLPFFLVINFTGGLDSSVEMEKALPENFVSRVKGKGVVHSGWVQQQHILAHDSVGCYLCHAGLSSVTEALVNDCQVAMLPLKGDQYVNSKLLSLDLKAGVEVNRRDSDGYFGKQDIYEAVKTVMVDVESEPGRSIRENQKKWSEFLKNNEIHKDFITNLVKELKLMAQK
jgi:hypothetical protein